jgi:actin-related protein 3
MPRCFRSLVLHPPRDSICFRVAQEAYCYVCPDIVKEYKKYDEDPSKFRVYQGIESKTQKPYSVDVGYERFLGPEMFFNPEIFSSEHTTPLPEIVDQSIQACPIDTRRPLYKNIVLSGGTTMFKDFGRRLQRDVQKSVDGREGQRQAAATSASGGSSVQMSKTEVKVISHHMQRFAVWFGGSMVASTPDFYRVCHTKAEYEEQGPRIARHNAVFNAV